MVQMELTFKKGKTTQLDLIREHLEREGSISTWEAIQKYACTRLGQYILLLRREGMQIDSEWQSNGKKHWVQYQVRKT